MGTVIRLDARQAARETERMLGVVGDLYQRRLKARDDLPRVLAELIDAGLGDLALRAIRAWGRGELDAAAVLDMCQTEAAVLGCRQVFRR